MQQQYILGRGGRAVFFSFSFYLLSYSIVVYLWAHTRTVVHTPKSEQKGMEWEAVSGWHHRSSGRCTSSWANVPKVARSSSLMRRHWWIIFLAGTNRRVVNIPSPSHLASNLQVYGLGDEVHIQYNDDDDDLFVCYLLRFFFFSCKCASRLEPWKNKSRHFLACFTGISYPGRHHPSGGPLTTSFLFHLGNENVHFRK